MKDEEKTREQLIEELESLRREVVEFKASESESKTAEERLSMLAQVVEQVGEGVASSDLDGRLTFVNRVFAVSHGYMPEEVIGRHLSIFHTPEQLENDVKPFIEEVKRNGFARREIGHKRRDGTLFLTDMTATMMLDRFGNPVGMTAVAQDITERKHLETALRKSEERYHGLYDSIQDGIVMCDMEGNFLECNKAYADMLGYTPEALKTLSYQQMTPAKWHEMEAKIVKTQIIERGYSDVYEKEYIKKDGTVFPIVLRVWLIVDKEGKPTGMWGIVRDITERKHREEELKLHSEIVRNMEEGVYLVRVSDGIIVFANPKFERMFGYGPGEMIGKHVSIVNAPSDKRPEETAREIIVILNKTGVWSGEIHNIKKDGTPFWCNATVSTFNHHRYGTVWVSIHQDISERKQAEDEIRRMNEELKRRAAELESANKELEAFSYSVSHDLRVPLRAVDGFSRIILDEYSEKLDDEGRRLLNIVRSNTQKMGQLIEDILQFSRMGRKEMSITEIDMERLINEVFKEIRASVPDRNIRLIVNPLASAYGDFPMLRQVVSNLLTNAVKFTRPRDIAVIEVSATDEGRETKDENIYYIKDNGVGFDMKYIGKLFGVFQRLHGMEEFEGTGIGLAIVKRIITRHNGRVWAEGKVGEGAVFYFTLPKKP